MAISYVVAESTALNGTNVTVYTVPASTVAVISAVVVGNTDTSAQTLDDVKLGGNEYVSGKSIPAEGQILTELEGQTLTAAQTITVSASGSFLNIRFSIKTRSV